MVEKEHTLRLATQSSEGDDGPWTVTISFPFVSPKEAVAVQY